MKYRFLNSLLAILIFICFCDKAGAQNIQADAKLQQYTIRIGDQTKLFLAVHQTAKEHFSFPRLADTITGKIQVVSTNKPDTAYDQNDHDAFTVTQSYTITSFDAGTYTIPPFSIGSESGIVKTNELTLQVETVKVDTTKSIYDIKQPLAVTYTWLDWLRDNWYWVAISLVGLAIAAGLIIYFLKRPKVAPVVRVVKPTVPPHVTAINQLKELRDKKLWQQGEVKEYHVELSDIIREYLEKRYVIKTHEKTTDEIFTALKHMEITDENRNKLKQILVLADLVKFAKAKPLPPENEQGLEIALDFVVSTQQIETAVHAEGGKAHV